VKPRPCTTVRNNQGTRAERNWSAILLLVLCFSLVPLWLICGIFWIAIAWVVAFVWLVRNRPRTKQALESVFGKRVRRGVALLLIANVALSFAIIHETIYSGNLQWGVEEGDKFSYSIELGFYFSDYGDPWFELNNTIVVFEITSLPAIPLYCDREIFHESIVDTLKASVAFENGSSLNPDCASVLTILFSNSFLPIGDWVFIDGLYYDYARGGFGASVQDSWFSRFEGDTLRFGRFSHLCYGTFGWDAEVSLEDGVPAMIRDFQGDWNRPTIILTRN